MRRQTVVVDIPVYIPDELRGLSRSFAYVLLNIGSLYQLQLESDLSLAMENGIWRDVVKQLKAVDIPLEQITHYEEQIKTLERGIYDLFPITIKSGEDEINLIIGKVFSSEGSSVSYYSGAAGVINNKYEKLIDQFDSRLDKLNETLTANSLNGSESIINKAPKIKCLDVFSLAGGLDVSHKPICVFFSGGVPENISSLSNMTVFLNLYSVRFKALTTEIAKSYILGSQIIEELPDSEISMLLLIWLRGHDIGHFIGEDKLGEKMSEFDTDYMILHELKSDLIALYSFKMFSDDLLSGGLLDKIYYLSIAEMLRYIRRGNILKHPDSASAYLAWSYFERSGAIKYDPTDNGFSIDLVLLEDSIAKLTNELLDIFAKGNVEKARELVRRFGSLENLNDNDISPKDSSEILKEIINDTDIPHYIDYSFITDEQEF